MYITKTDYLEYTFCRKNLWLRKHKPDLFQGKELSEFEKKIIEEGNVADESARHLFPEGTLIELVGMRAVPQTQNVLALKPDTLFQGAFSFEEFFVQADILRWNGVLNGWELYEVKATNDVKREVPHHHVNDLAFQKQVIEGTGLTIVKAGVIHLNSAYRQKGKVNFQELFITADLTEEVLMAEEAVREEMEAMKVELSGPEPKGCDCLYRGRSAQCTTFAYSYPDVPEYSVHDINRIGGSKALFYDWIDRSIFRIEDIDNPEKLKGAKRAQYDAYMAGSPIIDHEGIKELLSELIFPLQFFDYEGYSSAIPRFDGFGAYEQVPFQYSLHTLQEDGTLEHKEFLVKDPVGDFTRPLLDRMIEDMNPHATVISWYSTYEKQRNMKLAELHPDKADFIEQINDNMFDLMTVFSKSYYVDAEFKGSASIKNVLPVIVPHLTYKALGIQKGDQAIERWERMINPATPTEEKDHIAKDLLAYCKLDTFAMVEIYRFLIKLVS
ncbi:hypothetical protein COV05_03185 [Candidatus Uhrbacteria bacterium CG10_big_fil_rev_8_21_14_0_10_48_16]|uniref:DUF2779 domain-containing protein n=1 Tax=Candidatus Uhrbacteria bacterium CG10_big_fil_rev_8_21_14_0_10_48_16 TaxID=1975038 RepID=A0A2M8LH52_9BACT|nr:MAG: hypothetical protein COV05_03185 [Candidatus Uhrbacteria bacterium CG10_big_fil_rev_8_21_14_0_10_48_16]